eukprot:GEMP01032221.1.p1 GENE.GEMP01032221.1~~GEMP01032221.1.p1  ORF type:complete len:659 (+),score=129.07 GEMP01032221.1:74-2050(+)
MVDEQTLRIGPPSQPSMKPSQPSMQPSQPSIPLHLPPRSRPRRPPPPPPRHLLAPSPSFLPNVASTSAEPSAPTAVVSIGPPRAPPRSPEDMEHTVSFRPPRTPPRSPEDMEHAVSLGPPRTPPRSPEEVNHAVSLGPPRAPPRSPKDVEHACRDSTDHSAAAPAPSTHFATASLGPYRSPRSPDDVEHAASFAPSRPTRRPGGGEKYVRKDTADRIAPACFPDPSAAASLAPSRPRRSPGDDAYTQMDTADRGDASAPSSSTAAASRPRRSPRRSPDGEASARQNIANRSAAAASACRTVVPMEKEWRKKCVSNIKAILRHFETTNARAEPSREEYLSVRQFMKEGMDRFWRAQTVRAMKKFGMQLPLKPVSPIWEVLPFLYLGGRDAAENAPLLHRTGITHIINCSPTVIPRPARLVKVKYIELFMEDSITSDVLEFIPPALALVKDARDTGRKCFIHCYQGINRSVFLCIAAILALGNEYIPDRIDKTDKGDRSDSESSVDCEHAQRLLKAWIIVARARFAPPVLTNPPFLRQLYMWLRAGMDVNRTPRWEVMEFEWEKFTRGLVKTMMVSKAMDPRSRRLGRKRTTADMLVQDQINARVWEQVLAGTLGPMNCLTTPAGMESLRSLILGEIENETRRIMPEGADKKPVKQQPGE